LYICFEIPESLPDINGILKDCSVLKVIQSKKRSRKKHGHLKGQQKKKRPRHCFAHAPGLTYYKVMFTFFQPLMQQTVARLVAGTGR